MMDEEVDESTLMVALYDFDPSTIDWPFRRQRPLPLVTGQVIQVIQDDGQEWALGHLYGQPQTKGYFPKNYTVSKPEYEEMKRDYQAAGDEDEELDDEDMPLAGPPKTSAMPVGPAREHTAEVATYDDRGLMSIEDPEIALPGVARHPVLRPQPPFDTTFEPTKSRMLRDMPRIPHPSAEEPDPAIDDIDEARREMEGGIRAEEEGQDLGGGKLSDSRASTPATRAVTRPERDFVRSQMPDPDSRLSTPATVTATRPERDVVKKHLPMELQKRYLHDLSNLKDLVKRNIRVHREEKMPYSVDLRARSTTCRISANIEPGHMRMALDAAQKNGARWTQMFRPGFNDIVNQSFRTGCNPCILSKLYLQDKDMREQFLKIHVQDVNGVMWFELQRRKDHLFYMRMDFVDVMMCHPDAWNFPDVSRVVSASPGEPINPIHGWYAQGSIDTDKEMEQVDFLYTLRLRVFPEQTFQALALGKIPAWVEPYMSLHTEAQLEDVRGDDDDEEATAGTAHGKGMAVDKNMMLEAGLEDSDDLYVKVDELKLARERTVGPDVLETRTTTFSLKGLSAMRIFLRSRGQPDNMKQAQITPKMIKDMSAMLGVRHEPAKFWYCMFALRYPLAPEWEAVIKNDTRLYLHLPSDRLQPVHPLIKRFREHLDDCSQNEFLWEFRGRVSMKCSDCGIPDSVVWCQQCTDYYCAPCFLKVHKSPRGKKHWPMPIPGSRYLTTSEILRLENHLPLLNVGFSNRRRFLANDNQSDKMGSRSGDTWLFFKADTFQAALAQAPEKHWYLKRLKPPRLAPDAEGYYYNFAHDVIADDASHIMMKTHEQKALSLLQKCIRGQLTRRRIKKEVAAAVVIQKCKMMWDCQKVHGANGRNAGILKGWYRKFKAKADRALLEMRFSHLQALWRGYCTRKMFKEQMTVCTRFQATFRGLLSRRRTIVFLEATKCIQRWYKGRLYGRLPVSEQRSSAAKIQALARGVAVRERRRVNIKSAKWIQAHVRGLLGRVRVRRMRAAALKVQTNWRRFRAQVDLKIMIYDRLEGIRQKRAAVLRRKLEDAVASVVQRNWRRQRDYKKVVFMRREKGEADKRTSTMLVALFTAASEVRHFFHPWFRHLPKEIQDILMQVKASLQRTIGQVPVKGKLANEELGRRGLRVSGAECLHYDQTGKDPDLASHMLLSVTRHLLSHVPAELFAPTVRWACYAVAHQAVALNNTRGFFPKQEIAVGKEVPPHPGDSLSTLWRDTATCKHRHDYFISMPDESLPILVLSGLPSHHRHVYLTAEVLVTMRQALDSPSISTDDHLKFQGLDASAGAQLMEVLGSELDHKLPLNWPQNYSTVAALAAQSNTYITELKPEFGEVKSTRGKKKASKEADKETTRKEPVAATTPKAKAKTKAKAKSKAAAKSLADTDKDLKAKLGSVTEPETDGPSGKDAPEANAFAAFSRPACLRVVQQTSYLMAEQDKLMEALLARADETGATKGPSGIRQSRYISVTDKLFEMADRAKHDHCSFALAVVVYHMVLRGLYLRVVNHRAALQIQTWWRAFSMKGKKQNAVAPAICIQRFWRGTRAALQIMRQDDAAFMIQHNYRAWCWNRRARKLLKATLLAQRLWLGAIHRRWLQECHGAATFIQKCVRGLLVRVSLDKGGREIARRFQAEMATLLKQKSLLSESMFLAKTAALAGKARVAMHNYRSQKVDLRRMSTFSLRSKHTRLNDKQKKLALKGAIQPVRLSVFEPMTTALKRVQPQQSARYGAQQSRVLVQVLAARKTLDRALPKEPTWRTNFATRRGRAAVAARRLAKKPKDALGKTITAAPTADPLQHGPIDDGLFAKWQARQFRY